MAMGWALGKQDQGMGETVEEGWGRTVAAETEGGVVARTLVRQVGSMEAVVMAVM